MSSLKLIVLTLLLQAVSTSNGGFILTAPKRLLASSVESVCISLHNTTGPANISLDLLHSTSDDKIATTQHQTTRDNECLELVVPPTTETQGRLHLQVKFDDMVDYTINSVHEIIIQQNPLITLIQTDKPVYKPGQMIQFRVLTLTHDLKPITIPLEKVWLESPARVRVAQWLKVKTRQGLVHLDFQLSPEPMQGSWMIKVERNNSLIETKSFEVREYVLPRFEVIITPPEFILADSESLTWNICAKYTYGQPVKGHVHVKAHAVFNAWIPKCNETKAKQAPIDGTSWINSRPRCLNPPVGINLNIPFDGCFMFNVTGAMLGLDQLSEHLDIPQSVSVTAVVSEANTEMERSATSSSPILHQALNMNFLPHSARYFKPALLYRGKLHVLHPSSKPASGILVEICVRQPNEINHFSQDPIACRNFTSDVQGFVNFTLPTQKNDTHVFSFTATAVEYENQFYAEHLRWHIKMNRPQAYFDIQPWYSPSSSFIEISDEALRSPRCNYHHTFRVHFTKHLNESIPTFNFLVKARGDLVLSGRVHPVSVPRRLESDNVINLNRTSEDLMPQQTVEQFGIKLLITPKMSPLSQLMIYYVRADGETVAATYTIHITRCFANKVSAGWQQQRQFPGAPTVLHIAAAPHSLCGIAAVDKSTSLLGPTATSDRDTIFDRLKSFQIDGNSSPRISKQREFCTEETVHTEEEAVDDDDLRRRRRFVDLSFMHSSMVDAVEAFDDFGVVVMTDLKLKTKPCKPLPRYPVLAMHYGAPMSRRGKAMFDSDSPELALIPVAAMAQGGYVSLEQAAVEVRSFFPETWLWELIDTGREGRAQVRRNLPHTVTEWVGGAVCLSPHQGLGISPPMQITAFQPFFVELVLPYAVKRGEVVQIKVALYSFLSHSIPVRLTFEPSLGVELLSEESSVSQCVEAQANWVHRFRIRATELGDINMTISAEVDSAFPAPCGPDTLISRRDVLVKPLLVKPEGFPVEITKSALICSKDEDSAEERTLSWDLQLPGDVVEGSARAEVNMVADLMGPTLENLGSLVQMPMGCGEQNMILFVPNLHVVNYLAATHQPNPKLQAEAIKNMEKGYQRELNYRHTDGSYSAFGQSDREGSMWLTAFVVKTFAQARTHVFIDEKDLLVSLKWISEHQLENGCFPVVGQVFHKDMRGGLSDDGMSAALTAYVLISLLETGLPLPPTLSDNAKFCLLGDTGENVYTRTLTTYALALLGDRELVDDALQRLIALASTEQEMLHWEKAGSESPALSVEMTAYAILALVKVGGEDNLVTAHKAVRWISQHRNAHGGFVSTQDTVVALEALSKYSASIPTDNTNLNILVTAASVENNFQIRYHDRMLLKRQPLPQLPTHVEILTHGEGCAFVQSWLRYNVRTPSGDDALELEVKVMPVASVDRCSRQRLEFCVRYKPRDQTSNMAVLEVGMASGFVPDKESLTPLDNSINVKRWEVQDDQVNFYFDSLSNRQVCLSFVAEQETEVENPVPANARLYDYYQPEITISKDYQVAVKCDLEPLPQPMPRSRELDNIAPNSPGFPTLPPLDETMMNSLFQRGLSDSNNLIKVSKPRGMKKRRNRTQPSSTESYTPLTTLLHKGVPSLLDDMQPTDMPDLAAPAGTTDFDLAPELSQGTTLNYPASQTEKPSKTMPSTFTGLNPLFVDVDHELEVPEGMEGPAPVFVEPLSLSIVEDHGCPLCWENFTPDFSSIYCKAKAVYKAVQRRSNTARLLLDLTASKNVNRLRKLIKIDLPSNCVCLPLNSENATVLLVLRTSLEGINELKLDREVNIWSVPAVQGQPEEVKIARDDC